MKTNSNAAVPICQPTFKRQQFLLAFLQKLKGKVSKTDLQKLVFMYTMSQQNGYYEFVPYKYGSFSFQLEQDVNVLSKSGYITANYKLVNPAYNPTLQIKSACVEQLRGADLIRKAYEMYPFYAINSEIIDRILPKNSRRQKVFQARQELKNDTQKLFSIGYEGKSIENFVNILLQNDIRLLCDVRRNPISRKFGFSQSKLQRIVETSGIEYKHFPELGIAAEERKYLRTQENYNDLFAGYRDALPSQASVLNNLYELFESHKRIALMCYELDPRHCHRTVIFEYMSAHYPIESENI